MFVESILAHTFHPRYLSPTSRVLDLGANRGEFAIKVIERLGCECVAVEPSPTLFDSIPTIRGLQKHRIAITTTPGEFLFHIGEESTASSLFHRDRVHHDTIRVTGLPLEVFVSSLGWDGIDLLKVDIEGAEIEMFRSCPSELLRNIAQMSVEFHDFNGLTPRAEVHEVLQRLRRLGFDYVRMSKSGHLDTWLINRRICDITSAEIRYIRYVVRNVRGFARVLARTAERTHRTSAAA